MSTEFPNHTIASPSTEEVDGNVVEKRIDFELSGLDYSFVFSPPAEDPAGGATLTYVGDVERGRLTPSKFAIVQAWIIANSRLGIG
jgi:hypothetical protein